MVASIELRGVPIILSGGDDSSVIAWDPGGRRIGMLEGHRDWVRAICVLNFDGSSYLATGGDDRVVRIWNAGDWKPVLEIPVYHPVASIAQSGRAVVVGSDAGLLGLSLSSAFLMRGAALDNTIYE